MALHSDLREFVELLNSTGVEFVVVGAHAVAYHGRPRYTGDLDLFVRPSMDNARRIVRTLQDFGFEALGIDIADLIEPGRVVQLGVAPNRIDMLTALTGVSFDQAWEGSEETLLDGVPVRMLGRRELLANKRALGRPRDLADIEFLEEE